MNVFKIAQFLSKGDNEEFDVPLSEQKRFLSSLREPNNEVERSFNQYRCQRFFEKRWKRMLIDISSFLILPIAIIILWIDRIFIKRRETIESIGCFKGIEEVIPEELSDCKINNEVFDAGYSLSLEDIVFILKYFWKFVLSPFFVLKCILKISAYSTIVKRYCPQTIFVHNEYSYTSSVLTLYCNCHGVQHVNIMHGEKGFFIRDSFFRFDKCYVWDQYYVDLFLKLRVAPEQFIIAIPPSLKICDNKYDEQKYYADFKYYLTIYNDTEIRSIVASMDFAKRQGYSVKYRPHPRYSDVSLLKKYVPDDEIEYPQDVPILYSVFNMATAVGSISTVLIQAYFSGKRVILDDISFNNQYNEMKEREYLLANKNLPSLSSFQNE